MPRRFTSTPVASKRNSKQKKKKRSAALMVKDPSTPRDYLSCSPTEIRMEIYKMCDALTLFLNWDEASIYLPSSARVPTPLQIWIATFQSDSPVDFNILPLVDRHPDHVSEYSGEKTCLPDASVLTRFIKSESMLKRIYDSKLPVPDDVFGGFFPTPFNAVHAALRNCWLDLIDYYSNSTFF